MKKIPLKYREEMSKNPLYNCCSLFGQDFGECEGRITWDHPIRYAGSQVVLPWATNPLCARHHNVDAWQDDKTYRENVSRWVVLSQATKEQIDSICKAEDYHRTLRVLESKYGIYKRILPPSNPAYGILPLNRNFIPTDDTKTLFSNLHHVKPRQFWYPVNEVQKQIIQKAITHFKEIEGVHYTPFQMIERMIVEFGDNLDALDQENRI